MADLSLVFIMAVWGSSFALLRTLLSGGAHSAASPLLLLGARMTLSTALLLLFLAARRKLVIDRALWRDGLICGGLLALGFVLQTEGLQRTSASRSGFLTGLLVVFVPLLEMALFRKKPPLPALLGVALAFCGMALLSGPWREQAPAALVGDLLTVGCSVIFAAHILALGRVASRHPVLPLLLLQLGSVAVAALLIGPAVEQQRLSWSPRMGLALAYLSLACTLLAFGVQTWAQRHTTPVRIALISALEPVFAALWAALLLGERLSPVELAGGALIVCGVVLGEVGPVLMRRAQGRVESG
jgi:drug/metabolite transporter (DMT)-like permease